MTWKPLKQVLCKIMYGLCAKPALCYTLTNLPNRGKDGRVFIDMAVPWRKRRAVHPSFLFGEMLDGMLLERG